MQRHNWVPLIFLVVGLALVLRLGVADLQASAERIELETRITAEQLKLRLESCFDTRASLVRTLASYPWSSANQVEAAWADRASALFPLYSGIQALNYVDADGIIRVVYPLAPNRAALNARLPDNPNPSVVAALSSATATGRMTRTGIIDLLQGGKGFALYQPIALADGEAAGFVNGVFRVDALMNSCLAEGRLRRDFAFSLSDLGTVFFTHEGTTPVDDGVYEFGLDVNVTGAPWHFTIAPLPAYLRSAADALGHVWIALGVLLILLLSFVIRVALLKQRDIEAREDEYRLLVENQTDLLVKVNMQGEFQYVSPSYCDMFGKSREELVGKAFMPLVHEQDREATARSLERLRQPPHNAYHEQRAMTRDGWRWLAWSNRAVLDDKGEMVGVTAVGRDVTDIKRLEERIAHAQKMRAMGELAGGITHDFNNLLQVVLGNIEYLLAGNRHDAETRAALEKIRDIGMRAMSLTRKLATLSRQEVTRPEAFDVNDFLGDLEELLGHTLPASVELVVSLSSEALPIYADRSQLEQVFLNLCFNARDAIDSSGSIRISASRRPASASGVELDPQPESADYIVITVEDDGHGIAPENLSRVFDPFFTTKGSGTGTGLGLANSYSIVERHRGTITVDSTPGEGSRFSVYLPLSEDGRPDAGEPAPELPMKRRAERSPRLVLVADDDADVREVTCRILEREGFRTCTAENGNEALEVFRARQDEIGLLVLDLVMPGMTGQDVATAVRELSTDVPILFISGYIPEKDLQALSEPVVRKPYSIEQLLAAVEQLL